MEHTAGPPAGSTVMDRPSRVFGGAAVVALRVVMGLVRTASAVARAAGRAMGFGRWIGFGGARLAGALISGGRTTGRFALAATGRRGAGAGTGAGARLRRPGGFAPAGGVARAA